MTAYTWVQCDNIKCQKWRRIATSDAEGLEDKQWFCYMNTDTLFDLCDAPEEDYTAYDKLARKLGWKYVMSHLCEGSLVWAKMTGYCKLVYILIDPLLIICSSSYDLNMNHSFIDKL